MQNPPEVHQHVSHLAAEEFWHQGDLERHEFNTDPPPIMDRKVALEQVQIQFLDDICLSLYKDMSRFSSALEPLLEGCLANRQRWINLKSNSQADSETGEEHARNLVVQLVQQLESKAVESGDFLTKNKLEEIISSIKVSKITKNKA